MYKRRSIVHQNKKQNNTDVRKLLHSKLSYEHWNIRNGNG